MARDDKKRWRCRDCGDISLEGDLLSAINPFDAGRTIVGCPQCKSVGDFEEVCDEPGCCNQVMCCFQTTEVDNLVGHRRTCHEHSTYAVRLTGVEGFA